MPDHSSLLPDVSWPYAQILVRLSLSLSLGLLMYGVVFLLLHVAGALTQREFGDAGFYVVSVVGGLMSSASAVAAAATLAAQGALPPPVAGTGAVLASFTSMAFSLSFVLRTRQPQLMLRLGAPMLAVAAAGVAGLLLWERVHPVLLRWLPALGRLGS